MIHEKLYDALCMYPGEVTVFAHSDGFEFVDDETGETIYQWDQEDGIPFELVDTLVEALGCDLQFVYGK